MKEILNMEQDIKANTESKILVSVSLEGVPKSGLSLPYHLAPSEVGSLGELTSLLRMIERNYCRGPLSKIIAQFETVSYKTYNPFPDSRENFNLRPTSDHSSSPVILKTPILP